LSAAAPINQICTRRGLRGTLRSASRSAARVRPARRGLSRNVVESEDAPELAADRVCGVLTHVTPCPPGGEAGQARGAGPGLVRR